MSILIASIDVRFSLDSSFDKLGNNFGKITAPIGEISAKPGLPGRKALTALSTNPSSKAERTPTSIAVVFAAAAAVP